MVVIIKAAIDFLFSYFYLQNALENTGYHFGSEYFSFAIVNTFLGFVAFVILSISFRWWSSNCKYTPIPH